MADEDEGSTVGWDTLDAALAKLYGDVNPAHWGTLVPYALGGDDPLHGVSAYAAGGAKPHWHYVTYGFTDLFEKETDDPEVSGFGFELTFRLARSAADTTPPTWPIGMLQNLARYVFKTGNVFAPGHHMDANGPICLDSETALRAIAFTTDPELPAQRSPHGGFELVQIVGITLDELEALQAWNTESFLELARTRDPQLVTDLARTSWLSDGRFAADVHAGTERDGSSCGSLFNARFGFRGDESKPAVTLGANQVKLLVRLLRGRLGHGQNLALVGAEQRVRFQPGAAHSAIFSKDALEVVLTENDVLAITQTLRPQAGRYDAGGLSWQVEKTHILNDAGEVAQEIG